MVSYADQFTKQFGTSSEDEITALSTDVSGNLYVAGNTRGSLFGKHAGGVDYFIVKYDSNGNQIWVKQIGSSGDDIADALSTNTKGFIYVVVHTQNNELIVKYDSNGNQIWVKQLESLHGRRTAMTTDASGNVYVAGYINETFFSMSDSSDIIYSFIEKYTAVGNRILYKEVKSSGQIMAFTLATDALGDIYIAGSANNFTDESADGLDDAFYDTFIVKFDSNGKQIQANQYGSYYYDSTYALATDPLGNVYTVSYMTYEFREPYPRDRAADMFTADMYSGGWYVSNQPVLIAKSNSDGKEMWTQRVGNSQNDEARSLSIDATGNVYVAGWAYKSVGNTDIFIVKLNSDGWLIWDKQFGTLEAEYTCAISTDASGNVYVAGSTKGSLFGTNAGKKDILKEFLFGTAGKKDIFIVKYDSNGNQK
jgi:hypothetical protein